jgi:hypothetical protein
VVQTVKREALSSKLSTAKKKKERSILLGKMLMENGKATK